MPHSATTTVIFWVLKLPLLIFTKLAVQNHKELQQILSFSKKLSESQKTSIRMFNCRFAPFIKKKNPASRIDNFHNKTIFEKYREGPAPSADMFHIFYFQSQVCIHWKKLPCEFERASFRKENTRINILFLQKQSPSWTHVKSTNYTLHGS